MIGSTTLPTNVLSTYAACAVATAGSIPSYAPVLHVIASVFLLFSRCLFVFVNRTGTGDWVEEEGEGMTWSDGAQAGQRPNGGGYKACQLGG